MAETKTGQKSGRGMAVAGLILGNLVGIPVALVVLAGVIGSGQS
jgi:hypothetical protein